MMDAEVAEQLDLDACEEVTAWMTIGHHQVTKLEVRSRSCAEDPAPAASCCNSFLIALEACELLSRVMQEPPLGGLCLE